MDEPSHGSLQQPLSLLATRIKKRKVMKSSNSFMSTQELDAILHQFKENLLSERKRKGLSQEALAEKSGVSIDIVKRVEADGMIKVGNLIRISRALDIGIDPLLGNNRDIEAKINASIKAIQELQIIAKCNERKIDNLAAELLKN